MPRIITLDRQSPDFFTLRFKTISENHCEKNAHAFFLNKTEVEILVRACLDVLSPTPEEITPKINDLDDIPF